MAVQIWHARNNHCMMFVARLRASASFHRCDFSIDNAKPHIIRPPRLQKRLSGMDKLRFFDRG